MPIKIPNRLPATNVLTQENIFVMTETRAVSQQIRPLQILLLNLMPDKATTETQLARVLGNTPLQIEMELLAPSGHVSKNTPEEHILAFYKTFDQVSDRYFDGLVITGAPVELMPFEEVDYWPELCQIMEWSKTHVHSTLHICWGAQAALYYHYGIPKRTLDKKLFGVFQHTVEEPNYILFRGFDDKFFVPHSRNTTTDRADIEAVPALKILAASQEAGVYAVKTDRCRQVFLMGHAEYDRDTLKREYLRDVAAGKDIDLPKNYFPNDDITQDPVVNWRSCAHLLYGNWLNYCVYQTVPYDIQDIQRGVRTEDM
ncbi:MAG: homoserine O-succinyltransferase [Oscillospiraceae bacterium]|nr:homoserine O-succinyltransferase [Oscillospiraceae bacterium]